MIAVAIIEAVALVLVVAAFLKFRSKELEQAALERRELLTRIQRPEIIPTSVERFEIPDQQPDLSALVGTINLEDT